MRTLGPGFHRIALPRLYDRAADSISSPLLYVGHVPMHPPDKAYFVDFTYSVPDGIDAGAVALGKFECTEAAVSAAIEGICECGVTAASVLEAQILYCKSACFHEDGAFNTIFGVVHWHGETGDVVFPRLQVRVKMEPGTFILFDCHEPHSFLAHGETTWDPQRYAASGYSHLISIDLDSQDADVRRIFELDERAGNLWKTLVSVNGKSVCERTGAFI